MMLSLRESNATAVFPSRVHSGGLFAGGYPFLVLIVMACVLMAVTGCASQSSQQAVADKTDAEEQLVAQQRRLEELWGVEVQAVRLTAADYMLDFRYRVLDADKAAPILDRHIKPHVIVERSGVKLQVPISSKLGPLRQTQTHPQDARNYYAFFANPARHVKRGDLITIVVGDFIAEHIAVE
jgi:hypothetical protein